MYYDIHGEMLRIRVSSYLEPDLPVVMGKELQPGKMFRAE